MKKFTIFVLFFLAFRVSLYGQIAPYDTLYNQTLTPSGGLKVSAYFTENGYPTTYTCRAADDFICNDQWTITRVFALGGYFNGSQYPQTFPIYFYSDDNPDGNYPGTQIYMSYGTVDTIGTDGFSIDLDEPLVLQPGHYWVTVSASVATGYAEWGWKPSTGPYNYEAVWKNPGDGFGTGFTTWTPITTVWPSTTETDFSFALFGINGVPASAPSPANGELAVGLDQDISWTNPSNVMSVNVYWGTDPQNLALIYSGAPITTFNQGTMEYATEYYWRVDENEATGVATGYTWTFNTEQNPLLSLNEDFDSYGFPPDGWTIQSTGNPLWNKYYGTSAYGQGENSVYAKFFLNFPVDSIGNMITYTFYSASAGDSLVFDHAYAPDAGGHDDQLEISYSTDAGTNWETLVLLHGGFNGELVTAPPTTFEFVPDPGQWGTLKFAVPEGTNKLLFKAINGNGNDLFLDNIRITGSVTPVELVSFTAETAGRNVQLKWKTETETNNKGFEVERSQKSQPEADPLPAEKVKLAPLGGSQKWQKVGFVEGNGTSTEPHSYNYTDENMMNGSYSYRLKQTDLDGSFQYSKAVDVEINSPSDYSLEQNYPNPFNPSTRIDYSVPVDSRVTLTIYNILGQKVRTLINRDMPTGSYHTDFNASNLTSGVYLYRIEAAGVNGEKYSQVKKMLLTK